METETLRELGEADLEKKVKTKRVASQKQLDALAASRAKRAQMKKDMAQAAPPLPPSEPKPIKKAKKPVVVKYESEVESPSSSSSDDEPPVAVVKKPKLVRQAPAPMPIPVAPPVQQIFIRRAR